MLESKSRWWTFTQSKLPLRICTVSFSQNLRDYCKWWKSIETFNTSFPYKGISVKGSCLTIKWKKIVSICFVFSSIENDYFRGSVLGFLVYNSIGLLLTRCKRKCNCPFVNKEVLKFLDKCKCFPVMRRLCNNTEIFLSSLESIILKQQRCWQNKAVPYLWDVHLDISHEQVVI